ncbi:MAG: 2-amino-4-hydroxy-6-hydroxymethyldihydropteridine diphosphokinase [Thermodesulfobacteriota bacterium]|nr:MAG: 2-amino-4-hydroxy-6-hydroxymethyldihydropteridine diphosphokinase [Thermodesulfobacteriota bacterium]RLG12519.1 MAG: 2-amino-4-hydroxy-6-hydroxymethyldihydropteridine diphosphokinase [Candidatus Pacearchaeota archaeon]
MFQPQTLKKVFLSLGSNLGNKEKYLKRALFYLEKIPFKIKKVSSIYRSAPWGFSSSKEFLNLCVLGETSLSPLSLLFEIKKIEALLGRKIYIQRKEYKDRKIDIDIILYENLIFQTDILSIPHPLFHLRAFVMKPALEIAPSWIHPKFNLTLNELYEKFKHVLNLQEIHKYTTLK